MLPVLDLPSSWLLACKKEVLTKGRRFKVQNLNALSSHIIPDACSSCEGILHDFLEISHASPCILPLLVDTSRTMRDLTVVKRILFGEFHCFGLLLAMATDGSFCCAALAF